MNIIIAKGVNVWVGEIIQEGKERIPLCWFPGEESGEYNPVSLSELKNLGFEIVFCEPALTATFAGDL